MGTGYKSGSMELGYGGQGEKERSQIRAAWCRDDQFHTVNLLSAPPRRLLALPQSTEDASIDLIAGILSQMTALLSDEANKNLINST